MEEINNKLNETNNLINNNLMSLGFNVIILIGLIALAYGINEFFNPSQKEDKGYEYTRKKTYAIGYIFGGVFLIAIRGIFYLFYKQ